MHEKLEQMLTKVKGINEKLSKRNRALIIIGVAAVIVIALVGALLLNNNSGQALFSDLTQAEAMEILGKIEEMGVSGGSYSGGTITVPANQADKLRAQLSLQGYPKSGLSYAVFTDNIDMMSTDFEKQMYKVYDLQDRIAATIRYFDGVQDAVVTISTGSESKYVLQKDKQEPGASVTVIMKGGGSPEPEQVKGMQRLIASAVPGMKQENVVVLDGLGNDVTQNSSSTQQGTARLKIALEQEIERTIQAKLLYLLTPIYGNEKVRVSVNSNVDVKKKLQEIIEYTPSTEDNKGVISRETTGLEVVGEGSVTSGTPGTETNAQVPIYPNITSDGSEIYYTDDKDFEYLVSQMKEQIQDDGGDIVDLSVGVVFDGENLSKTKKDELRQLIAATAGIDKELAEDKVALINAQFLDDSQATSIGVLEFIRENPNMKWILIGAAGLLIALLVFAVLIIKKAKRKNAEEELEELVPEDEEGLDEDDILNTKLGEQKRTREMELKEQIGEFAELNPEISAQLIKTWLKGGNNG